MGGAREARGGGRRPAGSQERQKSPIFSRASSISIYVVLRLRFPAKISPTRPTNKVVRCSTAQRRLSHLAIKPHKCHRAVIRARVPWPWCRSAGTRVCSAVRAGAML